MRSPSSTRLTPIRRRCSHTLLSTMFKACGIVPVGEILIIVDWHWTKLSVWFKILVCDSIMFLWYGAHEDKIRLIVLFGFNGMWFSLCTLNQPVFACVVLSLVLYHCVVLLLPFFVVDIISVLCRPNWENVRVATWMSLVLLVKWVWKRTLACGFDEATVPHSRSSSAVR